MGPGGRPHLPYSEVGAARRLERCSQPKDGAPRRGKADFARGPGAADEGSGHGEVEGRHLSLNIASHEVREQHLVALHELHAPGVVVRVSARVADLESDVVQGRADVPVLIQVQIENVAGDAGRVACLQRQRRGNNLHSVEVLAVHDALRRADLEVARDARGDAVQDPELDEHGAEHARGSGAPADAVAADGHAAQHQAVDVQVGVEGVLVAVPEGDAPGVRGVRWPSTGVVDHDAEGVRGAGHERLVVPLQLHGVVGLPRGARRHFHEAEGAHPRAEDPVARPGRGGQHDVEDLGVGGAHRREREEARGRLAELVVALVADGHADDLVAERLVVAHVLGAVVGEDGDAPVVEVRCLGRIDDLQVCGDVRTSQLVSQGDQCGRVPEAGALRKRRSDGGVDRVEAGVREDEALGARDLDPDVGCRLDHRPDVEVERQLDQGARCVQLRRRGEGHLVDEHETGEGPIIRASLLHSAPDEGVRHLGGVEDLAINVANGQDGVRAEEPELVRERHGREGRPDADEDVGALCDASLILEHHEVVLGEGDVGGEEAHAIQPVLPDPEPAVGHQAVVGEGVPLRPRDAQDVCPDHVVSDHDLESHRCRRLVVEDRVHVRADEDVQVAQDAGALQEQSLVPPLPRVRHLAARPSRPLARQRGLDRRRREEADGVLDRGQGRQAEKRVALPRRREEVVDAEGDPLADVGVLGEDHCGLRAGGGVDAVGACCHARGVVDLRPQEVEGLLVVVFVHPGDALNRLR
mmetsp:Transcript_37355/g.110821  ORF Transcript_37355/g.110821 Transcript_37355/m.110821 type:complete len:754 (-) Transcript_37355:447-2708(-)